MSDFSHLYKKYNSVSELTDELNSSVITLKRQVIAALKGVVDDSSKFFVKEDDIKKAKHDILDILANLVQYFDETQQDSSLNAVIDKRLLENQLVNNIEFKSQVKKTLAKLQNNENLTEQDLTVIDNFISVLDNEAAVLFRKLRTYRG